MTEVAFKDTILLYGVWDGGIVTYSMNGEIIFYSYKFTTIVEIETFYL